MEHETLWIPWYLHCLAARCLKSLAPLEIALERFGSAGSNALTCEAFASSRQGEKFGPDERKALFDGGAALAREFVSMFPSSKLFFELGTVES